MTGCLWGILSRILSIPAHEGGQSQRSCSTLQESRQDIWSSQGTSCSQTDPKSP